MNTKATIAYPLLPSFQKLKLYAKKVRQMSLTRAMQYVLLEQLPPIGNTLDVGGGEVATYLSLLKYSSYQSINIDPQAKPTWTISVGDAFPISNSTFDTAISMNTFEHVYDVQFLLNEVARVLKPKGKFIASTPFLHPIHAHPDDFFRPTPSWWFESLRRAGFTEVTVAPLGWGPLSTGLIASGTHGPFRVRQRQIALLLDLMFMKTLERGKSLEHVKEAILKHALGFFVTASK